MNKFSKRLKEFKEENEIIKYDVTSKFSKRLKELREEKQITQIELADIAGVSVTSISRYEKGERSQPKMSILQVFAQTFDVSCDYLTGESDITDKYFTSAEIARIFKNLNLDNQKVLMGLARTLLKMEGKK